MDINKITGKFIRRLKMERKYRKYGRLEIRNMRRKSYLFTEN